jgi:hypothetical protein
MKMAVSYRNKDTHILIQIQLKFECNGDKSLRFPRAVGCVIVVYYIVDYLSASVT